MFGGAGTLLLEIEVDPSGEAVGLVGGEPECQWAWLGL